MMKSTLRTNLSAWGLEYWAVLGSIACFVAMVVLLAIYDGKVIFTWNDVTLNTLVSILSLAIKASLAYVLAECMAQWKWILFAREARPLMDFERIDQATRGPLGSLRVLTRMRGALPLQFGAILTLLAIGLDPLAQQLVQFKQSVVFTGGTYGDPSKVALISRATTYDMGYTMETSFQGNNSQKSNYTLDTQTPLSMQAAMLLGLSRSPWEIDQEALVQCPTSNCTWDQFNTLGVCHKCNDVTSDLRRVTDFGKALVAIYGTQFDGYTVPSTAFSLPNGHFIANIDGCPPYNGKIADCKNEQPLIVYSDDRYAITTFSTGSPNKTVSMKNVDSMIWSTSVIYPDMNWLNKSAEKPGSNTGGDLKLWPDVPIKAMECAIHYCIKTTDSSVEGNRLLEDIKENTDFKSKWDVTQEVPDDATDEVKSLYSDFDNRQPLLEFRDLTFSFPDNLTEPWYTVSAKSIKSLSDHVRDLFVANLTTDAEVKNLVEKKLGKGAVGFNGASFGPDEDLTMESSPPSIDGLWSWQRSNLSSNFYTLATSMTNEMRRNYQAKPASNLGQDKDRFQDGTMSQYGRIGSLTVMYDIRWPWIVLHGAMLFLVVAFLAVTLYNSGGPDAVPLWKSSSLGTFRRGHEVGDLLGGVNTVGEMEKVARKTYVKVPQKDLDEAAARDSGDDSVDDGVELRFIEPDRERRGSE
ncbi:hypothetical protein G7046_g6700 [Stylonectria norvegica]|nr:hypothetical protein G7046_g6700 [Stylonectria norvegica]